jgi:hypothetical protein
VKRFLASLFLIIPSAISLHAQQFENGGLEDDLPTTMSEMPDHWESVPFDDRTCQASESSYASPDLTGHDHPDPQWWLNGDPHSGQTFISASRDYMSDGKSKHDEGIMQDVEDLVPGRKYTIEFYQAVVREDDKLDNYGAWQVYADNLLIGTSDASYSDRNGNTNKIDWEKRTIVFTASRSKHTFKFLPTNPKATKYPESDNGLRMGIDDISIQQGSPVDVSVVTGPVVGVIIVQNNDSSALQLNIFPGMSNVPKKQQSVPVGGSSVDLNALPPGEYRFEFMLHDRMTTIQYEVK